MNVELDETAHVALLLGQEIMARVRLQHLADAQTLDLKAAQERIATLESERGEPSGDHATS